MSYEQTSFFLKERDNEYHSVNHEITHLCLFFINLPFTRKVFEPRLQTLQIVLNIYAEDIVFVCLSVSLFLFVFLFFSAVLSQVG